MRTVNETQIKEILKNREKLICNIHKKMNDMYRELANVEEVIETAAFPVTEISGMPGGKGGHKDLTDVILKYKHRLYNRNEEIRKVMWELAEQEETIGRVWSCFQVLPDPYYSILSNLYVENQLYQAVEDEFDGSHKTFERYRQQGMELLLRFYNSGESPAELMRRQTLRKQQKKLKGNSKVKGEEKQYEQISLFPEKKEEAI